MSEKKTQESSQIDKQAKLAEALKNNLRRRKTQQKKQQVKQDG
jgi:hypothetical protein